MCASCGCKVYAERHSDAAITIGDLRNAAVDAGISEVQAARNILEAAITLSIDDEDLVKAELNQLEYGCFVKAEEEQHFSLGLAYPALRPDVKRGADGKRDFVRPEILEQAAWSWMRKSAKSGLYHFNGAGGGSPVDGCCEIVESYIWRADPWMIKAADGTEVLIREGDWLVGALWDDESWPMIKSLQVRGWSPEATVRRRAATPYSRAELRS